MSTPTTTRTTDVAAVTEKSAVSESASQLDHESTPAQHKSQDIALEAQGDLSLGPSDNVAPVENSWNNPKINTWKLAAVFLTLMNIGGNDASYGALIPSLEPYYDVNYTVVSLIFLSPFAGYTVAAFTCDRVHLLFGQRGAAFIGPACRLVSYIVISVHPPWPVIICVLTLTGYGNGLLDAAWNAWVGDMANANQLLGIMHGFYGLGATLSPLIATAMTTKYGLPWYTFFYLMIGLSAIELLSGVVAFYHDTAAVFREKNNAVQGAAKGGGRTRQAMKSKVTWICAIFLLVYVGCEVSIAGWIVTFMRKVRKGKPFASGMTATGFWLGVTVGRVTLGFVTPWFGERWAVAVYLVLCIVLQLLFWLIPHFIISAIMAALMGYFLGPLFPSAIIAMTKLLPKEQHVSAIGFSAAVGGGGAAVLPFAVGAIAQVRGVKALQPIVLGMLVVILGLWLMLPKIPKHQHQN